MNVLVTGGRGFVGRAICHALSDHVVIAPGRDVLDITDNAAVESIFRENSIDVVVHLAALVHRKGADLSLERYRAINTTASERLFEIALDAGVKMIVYASSIEVYGNPDIKRIDETTACNPQSYYAQSKYEAEEALIRLAADRARFAILRFAPVYAPDFRLNLDKRFYLPKKIAAYIFKDGSYSFHFCSVNNISDFVVKYLKSDIASGIYNICDAFPISARDFIALEKIHGNAKRVVHLPYGLSYVAITATESAFRLFSKSEPFLSRYNFKKLFKSIEYNGEKARDAVGVPRWGIGNTMYGEGE